MKIDAIIREKITSNILNRIEIFKRKGIELTDDKVANIITTELLYEEEYDEEDFSKIKKDVEYYAQIKHHGESVIYEDYEDGHDWYDNTNGEFWTLYRRLLEQKGSLDPNSINKLEFETLPKLMNCLGNPKGKSNKKLTRGLVIGDVQSGKTATYVGLICKAADAGFKVVILLTGVTETLRKQTQERVEEGIIGYTVRRIKRGTKKETEHNVVGVGKYEHTITATAYTSYEDDFKGDKDSIATSLKSHKSLVLFVVKKNVNILQKLFKWLEAFNKDVLDDMIHAPMLLIDDEADNASINTNRDKYNPTETNKIIRALCNAFTNATYVGFTATPFANVFIDPETTEDMVNSDLFPQDFIYVLPTPSSYIGAEKLFNPDEPLSKQCLKLITDIFEPDKEELDEEPNPDTLPLHYKHKKTWRGTFHQSLTDAIHCFYLANVIRDLRGDISKPRTMMINVSRFVAVHKYIVDYVTNLYNQEYSKISTDFDLNPEKNKAIPLYQELSRLYQSHYTHCGFSEEEVLDKENLLTAIKPIMVLKVNSKKGSDKLDYKEHPNLRAIAVGGLSLSRGLTLEGLITSYFYRNTSTFDVLMQMGRWFGYRTNYEDLCQIWTSPSSANWYWQVSKSTEELKEDLRKMHEDKLKPKDFGIRVHDISDDLQITSSNKMRNSFEHEELLDFWGNLFETPYVSKNPTNNMDNLNLVKNLVASIISDGGINIPANNGDSVLIKNVPRIYIDSLIKNIKVSLKNVKFYLPEMREFLDDCKDPKLDNWDVVFFSGDSESCFPINEHTQIKMMERSLKLMGEHIGFTGSAGRLGSKTDGIFAIKSEDYKSMIEAAKIQYQEDNGITATASIKYPAKTWFKYISDRNPCLMIYLVRPSDKTDKECMQEFLDGIKNNPVVGFGVGFPNNGGLSHTAKKYKVNKIYQKQLLEESGDDDDLD